MRTILAIGLKTDLVSSIRAGISSREFIISERATIREALEFLGKNQVSLILLNNALTGEDYREFCIIIRSQDRFSGIPVLLLAEQEESADTKIQVLKSTLVNDYISAPFLPEEIVAKFNVFIELRALQEELEANNLLLQKLAITDELTKLFNRRHLLDQLTEELERMRRSRHDLSCCLADLDFFKQINDRFGHQTGDQVLVELSTVLRTSIRSIDILGRWGGEEFLFIFPYTNLEQGLVVTERLRQKVKAHRFLGLEGGSLSLSFGLVAFPGGGRFSPDDMIKAVDEQLYVAKNNGRDRICSKAIPPTKEPVAGEGVK
jgi:two-component system, cell cycle response regulator